MSVLQGILQVPGCRAALNLARSSLLPGTPGYHLNTEASNRDGTNAHVSLGHHIPPPGFDLQCTAVL